MPATALQTSDATEIDWLAEAAAIRDLHDLDPTRGGLPSVLEDPQRIYKLLKSIASGNYKQTACRIAGIAPQTLYNLIDQAKAGYIPAIRLIDALEKAEAFAEGEMVDCVRNAAKSGPQYWAAGMTYLERRQPDRWGKRQDDSSAPKVIVQIGVSQGDVSVQLGPSPSPSLRESETLQICSANQPVSDKQDYVNPQVIDVTGVTETQRRESVEALGATRAVPARDPAGDPTQVRAVSGRKGFARSKGIRDKKRKR